MARDEGEALFAKLPTDGRLALRDRTMLLSLYNTGGPGVGGGRPARRTTVADDAGACAAARQGRQVAVMPTMESDGTALQQLLCALGAMRAKDCVFAATTGEAMTRFGIYKRLRRLVRDVDRQQSGTRPLLRITPHVFRHTTAVHLLQAGVVMSFVAGWTTSALRRPIRYAEITLRMKQDALSLCEPTMPKTPKRKPVCHDDAELMKWLASL